MSKQSLNHWIKQCSFGILSLFLFGPVGTAQMTIKEGPGSSTLGLEKGVKTFKTESFQLGLLQSSQTAAFMKTNDTAAFDFTQGDRLKERDQDGFYQLGDLNIGIRTDQNDWVYFSTAHHRADVENLPIQDSRTLMAADLSRTLPGEAPFRLTRYWEKEGEQVVLKFELKNTSDKPFEVGALGIPLVFCNNFDNKTLEEAHAGNAFSDPYIGRDAGYVQVVRLHGNGKVLVVVPWGNSPLEAYRPLLDDPFPKGFGNEGLHEWTIYSKSYAETVWKGVDQWNTATSGILKPGESRFFGLKFLLANSVKDIDKSLELAGRPVAMGVPGYVLPMDVEGKLFLKYGKDIKSLDIEPAGSLEIIRNKKDLHGWQCLEVKGKSWGRSRLIVTYTDGLIQTVNYKVIYPEKQVVASYGYFLTTKQWYDNKQDTFGRSPSVISYDYEKQQQVREDARVWIAGLSDEAGAGSWLGAIMKELVEPNPAEIKRLETFVNQTVYGRLQYKDGPEKDGVRKSLFYYEPDSMPKGTYSTDVHYGKYGGFPSWSRMDSKSTDRSYNYPHVAAAYWVMYRLSRNYKGLTTQQDWKWYLERAYLTVMAMTKTYHAQFGQMEGTVFILILNDLKAEGMKAIASDLEMSMKTRAMQWNALFYPFGSEMTWDSTGQEEVYMWSRYFGLDSKAQTTISAILAYMPTIPHWAYNGNARRFWDFLYAGKTPGFERMIHHYGSALNAIPVLSEYKQHPDDFYLLRVGYGGLMGAISNITQDGFAPCAFHSYPSLLRIDGLSGDYGTGFLGYAVNSATFITQHPDFGWLAFGGNCHKNGKWIRTEITTASKSKVFIAPYQLDISLDAGQMKAVSCNPTSGEVIVELEPGNEFTPQASLRINSMDTKKQYHMEGNWELSGKGTYLLPLRQEVLKIRLLPNK